MKKRIIAIAVLTGLFGCSEKPEYTWEDTPIRFSGSIGDATPETRTGMSGSTASFATGDKIGISDSLSKRDNVLFSFNGTAWSTATPMYWYNATSSTTFYAYYPYAAANRGTTVSIPILNDQAFSSNADAACDMLVAGPKRQARTAGASVALTFTHAFSLLQFNVRAPLISTYTLQTMTIQAGNTAGGTGSYGIVNTTNDINRIGYNLASKTVTFLSADNTGTNFSQSITKAIPSTGVIGTVPITIYAIVLPGQYANPTPGIRFQVTSLLTGSKTTNLAKLSNTQFLPGRKYVYEVQIGGLIGLRSKPGKNSDTGEEIPLDILN